MGDIWRCLYTDERSLETAMGESRNANTCWRIQMSAFIFYQGCFLYLVAGEKASATPGVLAYIPRNLQ